MREKRNTDMVSDEANSAAIQPGIGVAHVASSNHRIYNIVADPIAASQLKGRGRLNISCPAPRPHEHVIAQAKNGRFRILEDMGPVDPDEAMVPSAAEFGRGPIA